MKRNEFKPGFRLAQVDGLRCETMSGADLRDQRKHSSVPRALLAGSQVVGFDSFHLCGIGFLAVFQKQLPLQPSKSSAPRRPRANTSSACDLWIGGCAI